MKWIGEACVEEVEIKIKKDDEDSTKVKDTANSKEVSTHDPMRRY